MRPASVNGATSVLERVIYYAALSACSDTGAMKAPADITGGWNVSDQDFFFDEDEKPAAKSAKKPGSKPVAKKGSGPARAAAAPAVTPAISDDFQAVSMTVAVLLVVIGVLVGVVIGLFVGKGMATSALTASTAASTVAAPQLTQEQLGSGQLPAGHPNVSLPGASTAATSGK